MDLLAQDSRITALYDMWYQQRDAMLSTHINPDPLFLDTHMAICYNSQEIRCAYTAAVFLEYYERNGNI